MTKGKRGTERASSVSDLMNLPSTNILRQTWELLAPLPPGSPSMAPELHHPCFDHQIGLNALARATILRNILKTEIRRDNKGRMSDASWHIGIDKPKHSSDLFSERALGTSPEGWLHIDGDNTATLYDLKWRNKLCDGYLANNQRVDGLNDWFSDRYEKHLPHGRMTAHLLFETRFLGTSAIDNYIRFVLHGIYVPSANYALSPHHPYSNSDLQNDPGRSGKISELLEMLIDTDNGGRPIITVSCKNNPTAGSRFATTLVAKLGERNRSACYIPLTRSVLKGQLNDHGFRSVVEAIHRFTMGESSLACSAQEHDEAALAAMIRQIRNHLVTVPTVFVFDGFLPGASAFPALISFIRDEPMERVLRLLQHPDTGDWTGRASDNLSAFRQTYFVIVGSPEPRWMEAHRQTGIELQFTLRDQIEVLNRSNMSKLKDNLKSIGINTFKDPVWADSEYSLNALSFLSRKEVLGKGDTAKTLVQSSFVQYWEKLKPWQRLYLRALALSKSGLRWSTAAQIFEAYVRLSRESGATNAESLVSDSVGAEAFKIFINDESTSGVSAPLLYEYGDGLEAENYDIFDFPSQAVSRLTDGHPWIMARRQKKGRWMNTVDFYDVSIKRLVIESTTLNESIVIRRILAELCLQAYRVRLRHSRPVRRIDRRTARNLAEALLYGMMSIETPALSGDGYGELARKKRKPALPKFTQGEIPAEPEAAYSFLYKSIFTDLFCDGDPTSIARLHGNGELQLEMLLLMSNAAAGNGSDRVLLNPEKSVCVPYWWNETKRPQGLKHLLAIASCAKRACRVEILEAALKRIERLHNDKPLLGLDLLAYQKLALDHALLVHDGSLGQHKVVARLLTGSLRALADCIHDRPSSDKKANFARLPKMVLRDFMTGIRQHIRSNLADNLSLSAIDELVQSACDNLAKIMPPRKLPQEAIPLLTRVASLEILAGDQAQRQGQSLLGFERHLVAIAIYWLGKALALRLRKENPNALPRVGYSATAGFVRTILKIKEFLAVHYIGRHDKFLNRLLKSARGMLDTYTREQGIEKADHIATQVLECTYVRAVLPTTLQLSKFIRAELPTGDERLTSLSRCLVWLRNAELEMLSFSGQPSMRIMLCRERLLCVMDMLSRAAEHFNRETNRPAKRILHEGDGDVLRPLVDMMINDFIQYGHMINFMKSYSPAATFVINDWSRDRQELLETVKANLSLWSAKIDGAYNRSLLILKEQP